MATVALEPPYLGQLRRAWPEFEISYDPDRAYPFMARHRSKPVSFLSSTLEGLESDLLCWDLG